MTHTLYYSPGACSLAPHIVLEEIGNPFNLHLVSTSDGSIRKPEYLALNPKGRIPVLSYGSAVLTEVPAILLQLAMSKPQAHLLSSEPDSLVRTIEWFNWLSGTVHSIAIRQVWRPETFIHWATRAASYIPPKEQSEVVSFERLDYSPSSEPLTTAHRGTLLTERSTPPTSVVFNHVKTEADPTSTATVKIWAARNRGGISVHIEGGSAVTPFKQREELISTYIPGLAGLSEKETILVKPLLRRQAAGGDAGGGPAKRTF